MKTFLQYIALGMILTFSITLIVVLAAAAIIQTPKISVVPDCSALPACPNSQPRQPWHDCQCKPTPACKNICIIGATEEDARSCWNHSDYANQTTDTLGAWYTGPRGVSCAWSYSPGTYTKVSPITNPPLPQ